jgi:hypothetical protein
MEGEWSMQYFWKIALAAIIASTVINLPTYIYNILTAPPLVPSETTNYAATPDISILFIFAFMIIYIIFGLPTTLITDGLIKKFKPSKINKMLFQLFTYALAAFLLTYLLGGVSMSLFLYVIFQAYIYLFILMYLRRKEGSASLQPIS